jgi:hypothetical protein
VKTYAASNTFEVAEYAWAELDQTTLETQKLDLGGSLSLRESAKVSVKGDFEQRRDSWGGSLSLQLNGRTDFSVDGDVYLDGALSGWLSDGYAPSVGEEFPILRYKGSIIGNWTEIDLPQLPAGLDWSVIVGKQAVYLKVISTT